MLVVDGDVRPLRLSAFLEDAVAADSPVPARRRAASSRALPEVELAGARLGIACSYDDLDDYDEYDYDVNVILYLSTYGFSMDDASSALGPALADSFLADARATGAWPWRAFARLGCYDAETFTGSSFVLAPWGEVAAQAPALEALLVCAQWTPPPRGRCRTRSRPRSFDRGAASWGGPLTLGLGRPARSWGLRRGASRRRTPGLERPGGPCHRCPRSHARARAHSPRPGPRCPGRCPRPLPEPARGRPRVPLRARRGGPAPARGRGAGAPCGPGTRGGRRRALVPRQDRPRAGGAAWA